MKPTLEMASVLLNFNPWVDGEMKVGKAVYFEL